MSLFERFKIKKENHSHTLSKEEMEKESALEESLLKEILIHEREYPEDKENVLVFLEDLKSKVREHLVKAESEQEEEDKEEEEEHLPVDACTKIYLSADKMVAYACILPPILGGESITEKMILDDLRYEGISYGIQMRNITKIVQNGIHLCIFVAARGKAPVKGRDGEIKERVERSEPTQILAKKDKGVDFKTLELFQGIKKGTVICDIIPAEPGVDGVDVVGHVLPGQAGKAVTIPKGRNTILSKEGSKLFADVDGAIFYENGVFYIEEKKLIDGDVDSKTGNLKYKGDILIEGDVKGGVTIESGGDVIICGRAEAAHIKAAGTIRIQNGINSGGLGSLEAGQEIQSSLLEDVKAKAKGDIYAEAIVNSDIVSGKSVIVLSGRGIILGGHVCVGQYVEAKRIGNQSSCENKITIGYLTKQDKELEKVQAELAATRETLTKIRKNVNALKGVTVLSLDKKQILEQLIQQKTLYLSHEAELIKKEKEVKNRLAAEGGYYVKSDCIYPITTVYLGNRECKISAAALNCKVHMIGDDLRLSK